MLAGWIARMKQEYTQLNQKIADLEVMVASPAPEIEREQLSLMNEQLSAMRRYSDVLLQRIKLVRE